MKKLLTFAPALKHKRSDTEKFIWNYRKEEKKAKRKNGQFRWQDSRFEVKKYLKNFTTESLILAQDER